MTTSVVSQAKEKEKELKSNSYYNIVDWDNVSKICGGEIIVKKVFKQSRRG
jgi:hypothetical protein